MFGTTTHKKTVDLKGLHLCQKVTGFTQSISASPHRKLKWCSFSSQGLNTLGEHVRNSTVTSGHTQTHFPQTETSGVKMARGEVKSIPWKTSAQHLKFDKTPCNRKGIPLPSHAFEIINPWKNNLRSCWMPTEAPHGRFSAPHATPLGKYEEIRPVARI